MMISGIQMGNVVWKYLVDNDIDATKFYKNAYNFLQNHVEKIKKGEGHGTRYCYQEENIITILEEWKKQQF